MAKRKTVFGIAASSLLLAALAGYMVLQLRSTPSALGISSVLNVRDTSGQLLIRSVSMPAPAYRHVTPVFESSYSSIIALDVANSSEREVYLGLWYYADSGRIGFYSPGASSRARILAVPPMWSGILNFPIRYMRFVRKGCIYIKVAKCNRPSEYAPDLPQDSETIIERKYVLVPEKPEEMGHR